MNSSEENPTLAIEQAPAMAVRYGKMLYHLFFGFAEKGKSTMNDKVFKLICTNYATETNIVK